MNKLVFWLCVGVVLAVLAVFFVLDNMTVQTTPILEKMPLQVEPAPGTGGIQLQEKEVIYHFGLKNLLGRLADKTRSVNLAYARSLPQGFYGTAVFEYNIKNGNVVNFQMSQTSQSALLDNYLRGVLQSFSGGYSSHSDVHLKVQIDAQNGMIRITPSNYLKTALQTANQKYTVSSDASRMIAAVGFNVTFDYAPKDPNWMQELALYR